MMQQYVYVKHIMLVYIVYSLNLIYDYCICAVNNNCNVTASCVGVHNLGLL